MIRVVIIVLSSSSTLLFIHANESESVISSLFNNNISILLHSTSRRILEDISDFGKKVLNCKYNLYK